MGSAPEKQMDHRGRKRVAQCPQLDEVGLKKGELEKLAELGRKKGVWLH
jgi:Zn-finger nucleic acid-binding protein